MPHQLEDAPPPVRRCACGGPIGDGDYASGHRTCVVHRRRRKRATLIHPDA